MISDGYIKGIREENGRLIIEISFLSCTQMRNAKVGASATLQTKGKGCGC